MFTFQNVKEEALDLYGFLTYEELEAVQKEAGFFGTEGKCMVIKADNKFIVYVTTFGKEINLSIICPG